MTRVIVYVEGPSDKAAMEQLLNPLIERKLEAGVRIEFLEAPSGDRKAALIKEVPHRAARILANDPTAIVVIMPDLYPLNKTVKHETPAELDDAIRMHFTDALRTLQLSDDERLQTRFRTFCFKYELEALLLAAVTALAERLGVNLDGLTETWRLPVEDQNNDTPPKSVVQALFERHKQRYIETVDAPLILSVCDYLQIAKACPQCFNPFVEFLEAQI